MLRYIYGFAPRANLHEPKLLKVLAREAPDAIAESIPLPPSLGSPLHPRAQSQLAIVAQLIINQGLQQITQVGFDRFVTRGRHIPTASMIWVIFARTTHEIQLFSNVLDNYTLGLSCHEWAEPGNASPEALPSVKTIRKKRSPILKKVPLLSFPGSAGSAWECQSRGSAERENNKKKALAHT